VTPDVPELQAVSLVKIYGQRRVVDGVSLSVPPGEVIGLLGRNGAGKSTTFQMTAGFVAPDGGRVLLDGVDVTDEPPHARARLGLTYLPQERSAFIGLTARQNVLLSLEERGIARKERQRRATALLQDFGLLRLADQRAHTLSGGEARKLEIARALAIDPRYMLLDEPFAGIDPINVREMQHVIRMLGEKGIGVLLSDHNVFYAFEVIDRGYIIAEGRVLVEGPPRLLGTHPKAREAFLGEEFTLPASLRESLSVPDRRS